MESEGITHLLLYGGNMKKKIKKSPYFDQLAGLGPIKESVSDEEKLVDYMDGVLMFDEGGFSGEYGFEWGVFIVSNILKEYKIDPRSSRGRFVFEEYIDHALEEFYGDFNRWSECFSCGKNFKPKYSIEYVYRVLDKNIICDECINRSIP
jgi:hypothetical protein